ncbi:hypothetical protein, partial [Flavobacterium suncheonense]
LPSCNTLAATNQTRRKTIINKMEISTPKISIELLTHGKRKLVPIIFDILSFLGFLVMFTMMILQKNNIRFSHLIEIFAATLIVVGIMSFIISCYILFTWDFDQRYHIIGKIKLTENNIEINKNFINLEDVEKIYLKAYNTRGFRRGDGTNNKIEIKTSTSFLTQKFVIENIGIRDDLKNYALFLQTKNIKISIDGIDLK